MTAPAHDDPKTWLYPDEAAALSAYRTTYAEEPKSALDLKMFRMRGYRVGETEAKASEAAAAPAPATQQETKPPAQDPPGNDPETNRLIDLFVSREGPPPPGMEELEAYGRHSIRRARERYGLILTPADVYSIAAQIEAHRAKPPWTTKKGRRVFEIGWKDHRVRVAYDFEAHAVVSFLSLPLVTCPTHGTYKPDGGIGCPVCRASAAGSVETAGDSPRTGDSPTLLLGGPAANAVDEPMPDFTDDEAERAAAPGKPLNAGAEYGTNKATSAGPSPAANTRQEEAKMETGTQMTPGTAPAAVPPPTKPGNGNGAEDLSKARVTRSNIPGMIGIAPARKSRGFLKVAMIAVSHGGKTYSALQMARGIVEGLGKTVARRGAGFEGWRYDAHPEGPARVLVIDTEQSANDYDHLYPFDVCEIAPPYTFPRYREAYDQGIAFKYDAIIVDSGSHLWSGEGGILQMVDAMGGDKRQAWAKANPSWEGFKTGIILQTRAHLIVTFRATADIQVVNGKRVKVGIDAVARKEIEFEFNAAFELEHGTHLASIEKDRTEVFKDRPPFLISHETGRELIAWRMSGVEEGPRELSAVQTKKKPTAAPAPAGDTQGSTSAAPVGDKPTADQWARLGPLCRKAKTTLSKAREACGFSGTSQITASELEAVLGYLEAQSVPDAEVAS